MGDDMDSKSVNELQVEQIQLKPSGSPVMTNDEDRSSTMSPRWIESNLIR
jgi:hypothetical protein